MMRDEVARLPHVPDRGQARVQFSPDKPPEVVVILNRGRDIVRYRCSAGDRSAPVKSFARAILRAAGKHHTRHTGRGFGRVVFTPQGGQPGHKRKR